MADTSPCICQHCNVSCKNKYVLKTHMAKSKKCLELRGLTLPKKFVCNGCNSIFSNSTNLNTHFESCKEYSIYTIRSEMEKTISELKQTHFKTINELSERHEKELSDAKKQYEKEMAENARNHEKEKQFLEKQLERIHTSYENVAKDAVNRPTTATTHNTVNHIRNILSTDKTVDSLKHDDLVLVFRKHLTEDVLLGGQKALAKICSENIIHTPDDKMLLVCTDASRDKYKYMDDSGNVKEDVHARNFTKKIIKPLESVGQDVYDNACATIAEELESLSVIEYGKQASLRSKEERLINSLVELRAIDLENYNSKFLNELSILTKRS
jgi:flagellar biosynthesis GTPase FlhF